MIVVEPCHTYFDVIFEARSPSLLPCDQGVFRSKTGHTRYGSLALSPKARSETIPTEQVVVRRQHRWWEFWRTPATQHGYLGQVIRGHGGGVWEGVGFARNVRQLQARDRARGKQYICYLAPLAVISRSAKRCTHGSILYYLVFYV